MDAKKVKLERGQGEGGARRGGEEGERGRETEK